MTNNTPLLSDNHKNSESNSKKQARAFLLLQKYAKAWNQVWQPVWEENAGLKYWFYMNNRWLDVGSSFYSKRLFAFKTKELAEKFLETFKELIEDYYAI